MKNDRDIVNTLSSSSLSYTFTWVISRMCIEVPNLVIYNSNLRHCYMATRLLWLLPNKGLLRLHILFLFCNREMWNWNRFGLSVVLLFLFFQNSLRILWEASCKTAKFFCFWFSSYDLGPCMDLGTVYFGVVNFLNDQTRLEDYPADRIHREIWIIVYSCLFLILSYFIDMRRAVKSWHSLILIFIAVFYRHAESCQFAAFIINPIYIFSFRDGYYFKELNHGSIQSFIIWNFEWCHNIWEANIVSRC